MLLLQLLLVLRKDDILQVFTVLRWAIFDFDLSVLHPQAGQDGLAGIYSPYMLRQLLLLGQLFLKHT